jgi:hypothetical protein
VDEGFRENGLFAASGNDIIGAAAAGAAGAANEPNRGGGTDAAAGVEAGTGAGAGVPKSDGVGAAATGFIGAPPFLFVVEASRTSLNSDLISAMCVR